MKFNWILLLLVVSVFLGCSNKHISITEDRTLTLSESSSNLLYKYSKEDITQQKYPSGFYPLPNHLDSLSARIMLADKATKSIKLQYFHYHADISGTLLMNALVNAADRGVKVEMLIDDLYLNVHDEEMAAVNAHKNITVRSFNPTNQRGKGMHYVEMGLYIDTLGKRMHNKTFIVDNSMAVFGGRNIGDIYFGLDKNDYFIDNDMLVVGAFVNDLSNQFEHYFANKHSVDFELLARSSKSDLEEGKEDIEKKLQSERYKVFEQVVMKREFVKLFLEEKVPFYFANAQLYFDMPDKVSTNVKDTTHHIQGKFNIKYEPKKSILIVNPYFIPHDKMMYYIEYLRKKGVSITVVTNSLSSTDGKHVYAYYSNHQKRLLELGVKLYEIIPSALKDELRDQPYNTKKIKPKTALHAKTMIIDGKYFVIGSRNMDPRSRDLNTELVAVIEDEALSAYEKEVFDYITRPKNAFSLSLKCDEEHPKECEVRWTATIDGEVKTFDDHGDASMGDRIDVFFAKMFPIEGLL